MLGIKAKKGDILDHWIAFVDGFNISPQEFYLAFQEQLEARQVPGLELCRIEFGEGGFLSDRRLYLRLLRERLAFDLCAAPFGTTYFFSCRTVELPIAVRLWHILVVLGFFGLVFYLLSEPLGNLYASLAVVALVAALIQVMRNTWKLGAAKLDTMLLQIPAIGPIYEHWFRPETYYRTDTRLVYLKLIPKLMRELAEESTAAKGIKLQHQYQWAPILGDLYKPLPVPGAPDRC